MSFPRFPWLVTEGGEADAACAKVLSRHGSEEAAHASAHRIRRQRASQATTAEACRAILRIHVEHVTSFTEAGGKP